MSKDLFEMVMSLRPTRAKMLRVMILPTILPDILTAWKVNLGNASRVVVVAELVGATGGVGYELLQQQQLFDMAGALAWTLQLVFFVLIVQRIIAFIEARGVPLSRGVGARAVSARGRDPASIGVTKWFAQTTTARFARSTRSASRSRAARWWRCSARPDAASRPPST